MTSFCFTIKCMLFYVSRDPKWRHLWRGPWRDGDRQKHWVLLHVWTSSRAFHRKSKFGVVEKSLWDSSANKCSYIYFGHWLQLDCVVRSNLGCIVLLSYLNKTLTSRYWHRILWIVNFAVYFFLKQTLIHMQWTLHVDYLKWNTYRDPKRPVNVMMINIKFTQ